MPAYHSTHLHDQAASVASMALLPLHTSFRGPALPADDPSGDIIADCLTLFRANALFRNFEILGPADRTLIYGILFISDCLSRLKPSMDEKEARRSVGQLALESFNVPGEPGFPINTAFGTAKDRNEADTLRAYLTQFRQELASRLVTKVYENSPDGKPSKHWLAFTRRKFMNKSLS